MQSPFSSQDAHIEHPRSVERRRRGRGVDVMTAFPTPERKREFTHLPTPMTERHPRTKQDGASKATNTTAHAANGQLPTPQTLPRKRAVAIRSPENDDMSPPPSPSGHTTFFLSASATSTTTETLPPRRRPGLMFAQQMGLAPGVAPTAELKFGGRLGLGVGMGGAMRTGATHGSVDKVALDNPFLDTPAITSRAKPPPHTTNPFVSHLRSQATPQSPGRDTNYVPQAMRRSADRSMSPHPTAQLRSAKRAGAPSPSPPAPLIGDNDAGPSTLSPRRERRRQMMDENNPFVAKPGEAVRPHPTSEDHPLVTYVFRGSKKVFANPFVAPSTNYPPATLDASHPEYDTHPCPPPRLLWPTKEPTPTTPRKLGHFDSTNMDVDMELGALSDDEEFVPEGRASSDDEEMPARRGLLFGAKRGHSMTPDPALKKRVRL